MTDRISAADQLLVLLRQRLTEHSQMQRMGKSRASAPAPPSQGKSQAVQALAAVENLDDRVLKRAIIQNLLSDQLGSGLVNEAQFQQVVDRVTDTLVQHKAGAEMLDRLVGEMRAAAR